MTTRLRLYNDALLLCGERAVSTLTETTEPRRLLDQVWDSNGVRKCLEEGQWRFAMRTQKLDYDPDIEPDFGLNRAFTKPSDWVLTSAVCSDEYFTEPLLNYTDESGYWYSDIDSIYVKFVSDDTAYGMDLNSWPDSFQEFVSAHFASRIVLKTANSEKAKNIYALREKLLKDAKSKAAMAEPTKFTPRGSWTRARQYGSRGDRGNRGSLTG